MKARICPKCEREYHHVTFCTICGIRLQSAQEIRRENAAVWRLQRKHAVEAGEAMR